MVQNTESALGDIRSISLSPKTDRIRKSFSRFLRADGTVRHRRSLHGPCRCPSGTGLSPPITATYSVGLPPARALLPPPPSNVRDGAHERVHCGNISSCTGHSHDTTDSLPHSRVCVECGKLSGSSCLSPVQEEFKLQVMTLCASVPTSANAKTAACATCAVVLC